MNGVFLVCTIYVGTNGHDEERGYLLSGNRSRVVRDDEDKRPTAEDLFTDEISLMDEIEPHVARWGDIHRDHLALYRADGSLIQGGPTSWKTVLAAGCETIPVAACMEAAQ